MDEETQPVSEDAEWYLRLLNALCGEYEEWTYRRSRKAHTREFGHPIADGQQYFRKLFGPDRSRDAKLCGECGTEFLHLLFGTGGGTSELATSVTRKKHRSLLAAMRKLELDRANTRLDPAPSQKARRASRSR